ncbi:hypothetical protein D3C80_1227960 [compost metagenome]
MPDGPIARVTEAAGSPPPSMLSNTGTPLGTRVSSPVPGPVGWLYSDSRRGYTWMPSSVISHSWIPDRAPLPRVLRNWMRRTERLPNSSSPSSMTPSTMVCSGLPSSSRELVRNSTVQPANAAWPCSSAMNFLVSSGVSARERALSRPSTISRLA